MDDDFERRLNEWLEGQPGVTERRRVVRDDGTRVLVSKFDEGFAAHLHGVLERVPELFDADCVGEAYVAMANEHRDAPRAVVWRVAIDGILCGLADARGLTGADITNVRGGLDSVAALLDSALWTSPLAGDQGYAPAPGEVAAYRDAIEGLEGDGRLFVRVYGQFEGAHVVNYCAAPTFGRRLFVQAWAITTGPTVQGPPGAATAEPNQLLQGGASPHP